MTTCYNTHLFDIFILNLNKIGENVSWSKISYLKDWPEDYGSPFSLGAIKNLKYFLFLTFTNEIKIWRIPKFRK